jgi:hypothetical protein
VYSHCACGDIVAGDMPLFIWTPLSGMNKPKKEIIQRKMLYNDWSASDG